MVDPDGGRDTPIGRLGMGCVNLGSLSSSVDERESERLIREAVHAGVGLFDTADVYGSGASERVLGRSLGRDRNRVVICTKGGYRFREQSPMERRARRAVRPMVVKLRASARRATGSGGVGGAYGAQDFSAAYLRQAVDASLHRLRTDYIDVYQLHGPSTACGPETLELMADLIRAGKIREFGVGLESLDATDEWLRLPGLSRMQVPFGVLDPGARVSVFPVAERAGVQLMVRGVLASGLLDADERSVGVHMDRRKFELLHDLRSLAASAGVSPQQLAIWWVLSQPMARTVLVGMNSLDHLRTTVGYFAAGVVDAALLESVEERLRSAEQHPE